MVALVLVVCLAATQSTPSDCQEQRPPMLDQLSPTSCVMQGQQYAAEWLSDHPKWLLRGWRCESSSAPQKPA